MLCFILRIGAIVGHVGERGKVRGDSLFNGIVTESRQTKRCVVALFKGRACGGVDRDEFKPDQGFKYGGLNRVTPLWLSCPWVSAQGIEIGSVCG